MESVVGNCETEWAYMKCSILGVFCQLSEVCGVVLAVPTI